MQKSLLLSIWFIIIIKILFIVFEIIYIFQLKNKVENDYILYWKLKFEWIFNILMALVLIHIFYPHKNDLQKLTKEIRNLIFVYAILSLFSLLWANFL